MQVVFLAILVVVVIVAARSYFGDRQRYRDVTSVSHRDETEPETRRSQEGSQN